MRRNPKANTSPTPIITNKNFPPFLVFSFNLQVDKEPNNK